MKSYLLFLLVVVFATERVSSKNDDQDDVYLRTRIIGGRNVNTPTEAPYMISLIKDGADQNQCGGAIINSFWVVTAAHCVGNTPASRMQIFAGSNTLNARHGADGKRHVFKVTEVHIVQGYIPYNAQARTFAHNDLALLKVDRSLLDGQGKGYVTKAALLPGREQNFPEGSRAVMPGYGSIDDNMRETRTLKELDVTLVNERMCPQGPPPHSLVCGAASQANGVNSGCYGDSGSPLVVNTARGPTVIGVYAITQGPCRDKSNIPGAWTRIAHYMDWVNSLVQRGGGRK